MHLGESANTGAQLPAKEDPKLSESQGAGQLSENWMLTEVLKKGLTRVHLGEGANTGAQPPAGDDPKTQCLRRGPIVGGGRRWRLQEKARL